jgi:hypothetical protein
MHASCMVRRNEAGTLFVWPPTISSRLVLSRTAFLTFSPCVSLMVDVRTCPV